MFFTRGSCLDRRIIARSLTRQRDKGQLIPTMHKWTSLPWRSAENGDPVSLDKPDPEGFEWRLPYPARLFVELCPPSHP
jgi:hypothetical protein